jgi:hypothetical protein
MNGALHSSHRRRVNLAAVLIIGVYFLLASAYSIVVPIFEAPDEAQHFFFVREIIEGHGLPVQETGITRRWAQEGSQPPLYYVVAAAFTFWTDAANWVEVSQHNPYSVQGDPLANGSRNVFLHGQPDDFPWSGTTLAVHALRFVSILFGALSICITYGLARTLFPTQPLLALGAAAMHAFLPQFVFISAAVNNDGLAALACGAALWQGVRVAGGADTRHDDWLLGLLVGLAALTKLSGAGMAVVAVTAVLLTAQQGPAWRGVVARQVRVILMAALVAGWWYARNLILYGDVTGLNRMLAIVGVRNPPPGVWQLLDELEGLRLSFWGLFGWFSILLPTALYQWFDAIALIALAGVGVRLAQCLVRCKRDQWLRPHLLLPLAFAIVLAGVIRWGALTPGLQGRLLFPALAACAVILAAGLAEWTHVLRAMPTFARAAAYAPFALILAYPVVAGTALPAVIAPVYARPELRSPADAAGLIRWVGRDSITLLKAEVLGDSLNAGDMLPVILTWRTDQIPSQNYTLYIKVYGLNDELIASIDTFPGNGMYPTTQWMAHQDIVDRYSLRISPSAKAPTYAKVVVGWYERASGRALAPFTLEGQRIVRPVVSRVKVSSRNPLSPEHTLNATFAGQIQLTGYDLAPGKVTLYWKALEVPAIDYTVFVHALDQAGTVVAQADGQPQNGDYPMSAWTKGGWLSDEHMLNLPQAAVKLEVGLYHAQSGVRLPVDGQARDFILIELPK